MTQDITTMKNGKWKKEEGKRKKGKGKKEGNKRLAYVTIGILHISDILNSIYIYIYIYIYTISYS